jgi:hypothetical protein
VAGGSPQGFAASKSGAQAGPRPPWTDEDAVRFTRSIIADLRASYARYPGDPGIAELVTELLGTSPQFVRMWQEHEVATRKPIVKRVGHPLTGPLKFECRVLHIPETGQRLIVYCAAPGSPTQAAFRRLGQQGSAAVPR